MQRPIVVLGGGILPANAVRTRAELNQDWLYRCLHAADVYRQGRPCPVLVSGGKTEPDTPTLARAMRAMLEELGVSSSDIIEEGDSLNTYENAVKCSELLRRRKVRRFYLCNFSAPCAHLVEVFGRFE